jgi:hypothetical protein
MALTSKVSFERVFEKGKNADSENYILEIWFELEQHLNC